MNMETIKNELINRYKYIYENALYILAPYTYNQNNENSLNSLVLFDKLPDNLLLDLESFLLSDIPFLDSKLYLETELNKENLNYLSIVENLKRLLKNDSVKKELDSWEIFLQVRNFIDEQSGDLKNKEKKLIALDEYFRINRYSNDGKIWTSGYLLNFKDMENISSFSFALPKNKKSPKRDKEDVGVRKGKFIQFISNQSNHYDYNFSILTEEEKQDIYLLYHDELPWNLEIKCESEDDFMNKSILNKIDHIKPCGELFYINENDIFINTNDNIYEYYHLCPHCGYIVNIHPEILSDGIKKRIIERCIKDRNLFRKMYLYSELFSLDKLSTNNQKKLLKK